LSFKINLCWNYIKCCLSRWLYRNVNGYWITQGIYKFY